MQKKTEKYCFTLDEFSTEGCSGWYVRTDDGDKKLYVETGTVKFETYPNLPRQDVVNNGITTDSQCGFFIKFDPDIKDGETVSIKTYDNELLYRRQIDLKQYKADATNNKLIEIVEPFVELDIERVRQKLLNDNIFIQYKRKLGEVLAEKSGNNLRETLCDILADIKTTQHLLAAAYLDYTRYKDPDFLKTLPNFEIAPREKLKIDMRGDITGSNWHQPESDGRWAGPKERSSLLLPNLPVGEYEIELDVVGEIVPGALTSLRLGINGQNVELTGYNGSLPCLLKGNFKVSDPDAPYLAIAFNYAGPIKAPDNACANKTPDKRKLSFRLKYVSIAKMV